MNTTEAIIQSTIFVVIIIVLVRACRKYSNQHKKIPLTPPQIQEPEEESLIYDEELEKELDEIVKEIYGIYQKILHPQMDVHTKRKKSILQAKRDSN